MSFTLFGVGSMGSSLARALHAQNVPLQLVGRQSPHPLALELNIPDKLETTDYALLCVKPKDFLEISRHSLLSKIPTIISVMSGITLETLKKHFPHAQCVRTMPNIGVQWACGLTIFAKDQDLEPHWTYLSELFNHFGTTLLYEERYFDALTSLTGSGPAFVMAIMEAIAEGANEMGLPQNETLSLTKALFQNTLEILKNSAETPEHLIKRIRAPGGTTHAGLEQFNKENIKNVFKSAYQRAKELA
jgi:pyrroline-5-carboxylate reductase